MPPSGYKLLDLTMKRQSKSFTDSLYAILTAAGLYDGPLYRLSGLTGMAFKFTVHERLLPMSVSAYGQWVAEHKPVADNLGLLTVIDGTRTRLPTFRYYQQDAIGWIKDSLDRGQGVIYWIPEFGVIHGYDDEDRVFYYKDGWSDENGIVLYDNLGLNFTGFFYAQSFGSKVDIPYESMLLESFRLAIHDWDTPHKTLPNTDVASGKLAYTFFIRGLDSGDYDEGGAAYILESYLESRKEIRLYLREAKGIWPESGEAFELYDQLAALIPDMESCMTKINGERQIDKQKIAGLTGRLHKMQAIEDQAMGVLRGLSARYPDPKRTTLPRWGIHTPK